MLTFHHYFALCDSVSGLCKWARHSNVDEALRMPPVFPADVRPQIDNMDAAVTPPDAALVWFEEL